MKLRFLPAGLCAAMALPAPAHADTSVKWSFSANITHYYTDARDGPDAETVVTYRGPSGTKKFSGFVGALLDMQPDASPLQPACLACVHVRVIGDTVLFEVDEESMPFYGISMFSFKFDRPLGGDLSAVMGANFVSGTFLTSASGHTIFQRYEGPITGVSYRVVPVVPEPTSWVMLIFGFGVVGAALRRAVTPNTQYLRGVEFS